MPTDDFDTPQGRAKSWNDLAQRNEAATSLKATLYDQEGIINRLSGSTDPVSQRAVAAVKPEFEKNLNLYSKALKKYKGPKQPQQ